MSKRLIISISVAGVIVVAAVALVVVLLVSPEGEPEPELVELNVYALGSGLRSAVQEVMTDFLSFTPSVRGRVTEKEWHGGGLPSVSQNEEDSDPLPDVYFTKDPNVADADLSRLWMTRGYRLFARLPTIAGIEGALSRGVILPLGANEISSADFTEILDTARGSDLQPIVIVENTDAQTAWTTYNERLGNVYEDYTVPYESLRQAIDDLTRGRILFLFWDDSLISFINEPSRPLFRGFAVPGSRTEESSFFVGEAIWVALAPDAEMSPGARAIVKYLTSPGVARTMQSSVGGEFYSWTQDAEGQSLPDVGGIKEIVTPDQN